MAKITKRTVDALASDGESPAYLWDEALTGFGVKALPSGTKKYIVKYRANGGGRAAPQRWLTLGSHGHLTPEQARGMAQQALAAVARGDDPQSDKFQRRTAPTIDDLWKRFEEEHLAAKKPQTRVEYVSQWRDLIKPKFGRTQVQALTRGEVDKFHKAMRHAPYRANRTLALFSRLMSLGETWGWRPQGTNPCKYVERFAEKARTRFLNVEELARIGAAMRALQDEGEITRTAAHAVELLLLTGARLNEVLTAEWKWVDWNAKLLRLPDSKTGSKSLYLSEAAINLLRSQEQWSGESALIFPPRTSKGRVINLRKSWVQICERAELEEVRLHDLRHTAASIAVGRGASLPVIGRVLGHSQAQTTLRYAHVDTDPALLAVNQIGEVVAAALGGRQMA